MPKKVGTQNWRKKRIQDNLEKKEFRYYIFCEGEQTEPNYFREMKHLIESDPIYKNTVLVEIEPCAAETMRVIKKAEEYVKKNKLQKGQIWCVYDKDSFPKSDFNGVEERAQKLNQQNYNIQYYTAWSNECIEIWFILHFDHYLSNNHRTEYIKYLNRKFKELGIGKYEKNLQNIFDILHKHGNPKLAIRYAKRIIGQNNGKSSAMIAPGTKVYALVEELAKYLPEDIKKKFL
ncbi:MAG: RloB domain-containing protein [Eubacterium sp.]|nr:RloB domain-containing protein [Eubacterium sp.]